METKKLILYLILISSIIALISQTPVMQAVGRGQHTFISGRNVDCVECHRFDAYMDMNSSQTLALEAHKRAAGNKNYTTYLQVGGISYDPAGFIYTNVDSDNSGTNDIWVWNGSVWVYNNTFRLYDLDLDQNGVIDGAEICKLCHNLELMGVSTAVSEVHTVGTRYCDDDRCHGNRAKQYNSYLLFQGGSKNMTAAGAIFFGMGLTQSISRYKNIDNAISLITELNSFTKYVITPMRGHYNVTGFGQVCAWETGYATAVDFARGAPYYNPGETAANDLLTRKETDAAMIIAGDAGAHFPADSVRHLARIPVIQIDPYWNPTTEVANVVIPVAICGVEVEGTAYRMDGVSLRYRKLIEPTHPTDIEILEKITERVKEIGGD